MIRLRYTHLQSRAVTMAIMTAHEALTSLAHSSHKQAVRAVSDAQDKLCMTLDAKMAEIAAFRTQVAQQTKKLQTLTTIAQQQHKILADSRVFQTSNKALELQSTIERINQKVRVLEETKRRVEDYRV